MQIHHHFVEDPELEAQLVTELGGLAANVASAYNSYGKRFVLPEENLDSLKQTHDSFDQDEAINNYYGHSPTSLRETILNQSNSYAFPAKDLPLKFTPQRLFDTRTISSFFWRAVGRMTGAIVPFDVIDFGGGVGDQFYRSAAHLNPLVKSWTVIDLPAVIADGESLREETLKLISNELPLDEVSGIGKLRFVDKIPSRMHSAESETPLLCVANGVVMHLASPSEMIRSLLNLNPRGFFLGNCFEMGFVLQSFLDRYPSKDYVVVSAKSRAFDHKFAVWQPGRLEALVRSIALETNKEIAVSILEPRSPFEIRLYSCRDKESGQEILFLDAEGNCGYQFFF